MSDNRSKNTPSMGGKEISRRQALKYIGAGVVGISAASLLLNGCSGRWNATEPMTDQGDAGRDASKPDAAMSYRTDNVLGQPVSLLGFGTMRYPTIDGKIDEVRAQELVDYAYAHGVNYFDTAYMYHDGQSEPFTGRALAKYPRETFFLATKMPTWLLSDLDSAKRIFEEQLQKCRVDYFDYYLLHSIRQKSEYQKGYIDNGALDYLLAEKAAGRIKRLGFSFHGDIDCFEYLLENGPKWDFVQIQLNYLDWYGSMQADKLYSMLAEKGLQCIVMEPLRGGRLANVNPVAAQLQESARPADTPARWAFRFVASLPNVLTVLSGMTEMRYLKENIETMSTAMEPVSDNEMQLLEKVANAINSYNTVPCTECSYCMPCPYGVNIPGVFAHYNKCVNEGIIPDRMSQPRVEFNRKRREYLITYSKAVGPSAQASHCIGCRQCMLACPQRINIVDNLRRIDKFVDSLKFKSQND